MGFLKSKFLLLIRRTPTVKLQGKIENKGIFKDMPYKFYQKKLIQQL